MSESAKGKFENKEIGANLAMMSARRVDGQIALVVIYIPQNGLTLTLVGLGLGQTDLTWNFIFVTKLL